MCLSQHPALSTVKPLRGWVSTFFINYRGKKLGPYHTRSWKERGKLKREYVKPNDLERVRAACQANREKRLAQIACSRNFARLAGNLNYFDRIAKRADKDALRPQDYEFLDQVAKDGIEIPGRPQLRSSPVRGKYRAAGMGAHAAELETDSAATPQDLNTSKPQHLRTKTFMYPSLTKMKKSLLADIKSALRKPTKEKRDAETPADKLSRWVNQCLQTPLAPPNIESKLPDWLTPQEVDDFASRCLALLETPTEISDILNAVGVRN